MIKKEFISRYLFRILIVNLTGLFLLYDTTSFNQGLISLQAFFYSLNSLLLYIFIFIEALFAFLQYYGLDYEFINLVLLNIKNLDYNFVKFIIIDKSFYVIYFFLNLLLLLNLEKIIFLIFEKKEFLINQKFKIFFLSIFLIVIILFLPFDVNKKIRDKLLNFKKTINEYSVFRNDNWYISLKSQFIYSKFENKNNNLYIDDFSKIIDTKKYNNIFIIINESYPNFKNKILNDKLFNLIVDNNNDEFKISNYNKSWSKKYSTQGAELNLFCGKNDNFTNFQIKNLNQFIKENNCYFKNYQSVNKTFIISHSLESFQRNRYNDFFDNLIGFNKLKNLNLDICKGTYLSYCDHQVLGHLRNYLNKKEDNMIIFLTVNNHIPTKLISETNLLKCKDYHPLNILDQICYSFHNQVVFNKALSKFLKQLKKNELVIFYSDTPPLFPSRERIHFEDFINVYTFEKK